MESQLPAFKEKNPQLEVVTELIRGQHSAPASQRLLQEQKPTGDMCEEYGPRRGSSTRNKTTECVGKKGDQTED